MLKTFSAVSSAILMMVAGAALVPAAAAAQEKSAPIEPAAEKSEPTLSVGDKAPALKIEQWLKGEPVKEFESGKVYVVEFWATWCGPCIAAFPHLSQLQKEYKDKVTVIGTNIWERGSAAEVEKRVKDFVEKQGDRMSYTVAFDGAAKATDTAYMKASDRSSIPTAFVVDKKGLVAWVGHPMMLDPVIDAVLADSWDSKVDGKKFDEAFDELMMAMRGAGQDPAAALAALDKVAKDYPKLAAQFDMQRAQLLMMSDKWDEGYKLWDQIVDKAIERKDAQSLNELSWTIVDPEHGHPADKRNLDIAMKAATKAVEISEEKDPQILDTLARVHFVKGNVDKAIELQTKAIEKAPEEMKEFLQPALEEYKAAKEGKTGAKTDEKKAE